jgi:hypothetical protein
LNKKRTRLLKVSRPLTAVLATAAAAAIGGGVLMAGANGPELESLTGGLEGTPLLADFDEAMDSSTVSSSNVYVTHGLNVIGTNVTLIGLDKISISPTNGWPEATVQVHLSSGLEDTQDRPFSGVVLERYTADPQCW